MKKKYVGVMLRYICTFAGLVGRAEDSRCCEDISLRLGSDGLFFIFKKNINFNYFFIPAGGCSV